MANYEVDFAYSRTETPDTFDGHVVMYPIVEVPDRLVGKRLIDHLATELRRDMPDIAKIRGLRIRS